MCKSNLCGSTVWTYKICTGISVISDGTQMLKQSYAKRINIIMGKKEYKQERPLGQRKTPPSA